jgi:hypothetical protein
MTYTVPPGLYAVGAPDEKSPVLVSANYKMTFDVLRRELEGVDCHLLILDTKGVNVWCAAGKGTFGTKELSSRVMMTGLAGVVTHRELILPQLGAVGVSAHEVKKHTGFAVRYGPVRARDIKAWLANGKQATEEMRTVRFTMYDRLVLAPIELMPAAKYALSVFGVMYVLNLFAAVPFGLADFIVVAGAVLAGTVVVPVLLPFIPGRAFSFKGWLMGLLWTVAFLRPWQSPSLATIGYVFALPAVSAFLAMNFTGASTYTSPSGVLKEMKNALPFILLLAALGVVMVLVGRLGGVA